jgi:hypothetical protein
LFARLLARLLPSERSQSLLNVREHIDLESYRIQQTSSGPIELVQGEGMLDWDK